MQNYYYCSDCGKSCKSLTSLRSHMNWHNPEYASACSNNGDNISKGVKAVFRERRRLAEIVYLENPKKCNHCNNIIVYSKRGNLFCSRSCSASHNNVKKAKPKPIKEKKERSKVELMCQECDSRFFVSPSEQTRKYCSNKCRLKNNYHPNSVRKKTSIYKGFKMDSGAELAFAQLLDKHNIRWIKNSKIFFTFVDSTGKQRKYYPDFYLEEYDSWVEIKGKRYIREDDNLRLKAVDNIELIMSDDIKLPKCVGKQYGADEGL